jgi:hypothetical protein
LSFITVESSDIPGARRSRRADLAAPFVDFQPVEFEVCSPEAMRAQAFSTQRDL